MTRRARRWWLARLLLRPIPFVLGWRNMALLGGGLGALSVLMTLIYEPWGTADYEASWRTFRLSGYALCYFVPFVALHALDRRVYRWQGHRWWLIDELVLRTLLFLAVTTASWFYNIWVINDIAPRFVYWVEHLVHFSLPNLPILLPVALLGAVLLGTLAPEAPPEPPDRLHLSGHGSDEALALDLGDFLYAEAQQNYVAIYFLEGDEPRNVLLRMTLKDLEGQIPGSLRFHRSFLTHPSRIRSVIEGARSPCIVVEGVDRPLPASRGFDLKSVAAGVTTLRRPA